MINNKLNILFYLNPWIEKEKPKFRLGVLKNIYLPIFKNLLEINPALNIKLILGESIFFYKDLEKIRIPKEIEVIQFYQNDLLSIFDNYNSATSSTFNNINTNEIEKYTISVLGDFIPDIIISWEHPIDFFQKIYPNSKQINMMPGMFSRDPYPELTMMDIKGLFGKSQLNKESEIIRNMGLSNSQKNIIENIKKEYIDNFYNIVLPENIEYFCSNIELKNKYNLLLPLQVSNYFAFEESCSFRNQFDFLINILERMKDQDIGIIVTQYNTFHTQDTPVNENTLEYLESKYPNFIYSKDFETIENISQYLLKYVDGVISVSSSIGMQSLLFDKPVFTVGESHLKVASQNVNLENIENLLDGKYGKIRNMDNVLYYILSKHQVLTNEYLRSNKEWFYNYILKIINEEDIVFDEQDIYFSNFSKSNRTNVTLKKIRNESTKLSIFIKKREDIQKKINDAEVISFDIFDTLVERPFTKPIDLFRLNNKRVEELSNKKLGNFSLIRPSIERKLKQERKEKLVCMNQKIRFLSTNNIKEEVTLEEIYDELQKEYQLTQQETDSIKKLEIESELKYLIPKYDVMALFNYALNQGKKVILISDMYLDTNTIEKILKKNKIIGYDELYLSSEIGLTKHTGTLFKFVLNDLKIKPEKILHIGDNPIGDIEKSSMYDIKNYRVLKNLDHFFRNKKMHALYWNRRNDFTLADSASIGLFTHKIFNNQFKQYFNDTHFNGNQYNLGYVGLGTLFYSFTKWLLETSIKDNIETLYFLSRDGFILKKVYDLLAPNFNNAPKSVYLYSSRRACQVASIENFSDILNILNTNYSNSNIVDFFNNKFGVDILEFDNINSILEKYGWSECTVISTKDRTLLSGFTKEISSFIINEARKEREEYLTYLKSHNIVGYNQAIIDIGYAGTMQKSIKNLLKIDTLGGYYVMTFHNAKEIYNQGDIIKGYAGDFIDKKYSNHPICKLGLLFEVVFSNTDGSLIKFENGEAIFEDTFNEIDRKKFIKNIHRGVLDFTKDFINIFGNDIHLLEFDNYGPLKMYVNYLETPGGRDTDIMTGVNFDDRFGSTHMRFMLPRDKTHKLQLKEILWKKGYEVYNRRKDLNTLKVKKTTQKEQKLSENLERKDSESSFQKVEKFFLRHFLKNEKKFNKYLRDRDLFYQDMKNPLGKFFKFLLLK